LNTRQFLNVFSWTSGGEGNILRTRR